MPPETGEPRRLRLPDEPLFQGRRGQPEGDVHPRAAGRIGHASVEAGAVDGRVQLRRLALVARRRRRHAPLVPQPRRDQRHHVDREDRRRVGARPALDVRGVAQQLRKRRRSPLRQIGADDHHRHAGRAEVLLRAGVEDAVAGHVDRAAEHVRRRIHHERPAAGVGRRGPLRADDRVVRRHVDVGRFRRDVDLPCRRQAPETLRLGARGHPHGPELARFPRRLRGPGSGHQVVGGSAGGKQVHRDHGELQRGAPLDEQDVVVVGHAGQGADAGLGRGQDLVERRGAVADLQHRRPDPRQRRKLLADPVENRFGKHRRTGAEVEDPPGHGRRGWNCRHWFLRWCGSAGRRAASARTRWTWGA